MKRSHSVKTVQPIQRRRMQPYPVAYCLKEEIVIGYSERPIKIKESKLEKVDVSQWEFGKWLEGYEIDFSKYYIGCLVVCPKCGGLIDFRAFVSSTVPTFKSKI